MSKHPYRIESKFLRDDEEAALRAEIETFQQHEAEYQEAYRTLCAKLPSEPRLEFATVLARHAKAMQSQRRMMKRAAGVQRVLTNQGRVGTVSKKFRAAYAVAQSLWGDGRRSPAAIRIELVRLMGKEIARGNVDSGQAVPSERQIRRWSKDW